MNIRTTYIAPPIPIRNFDWQATLSDYDAGDPVGHGSTRDESIDDLLDQVPDDEQRIDLMLVEYRDRCTRAYGAAEQIKADKWLIDRLRQVL